jgi:hypothetical protein
MQLSVTKLWAALVLSLVLVACAGTGALLLPGSVPALQGVTGVDALMGAPCATNFYRVASHICNVNATLTNADLKNLLDTTCRSFDVNVAYGIPTSATILRFRWTGTSDFTPAVSLLPIYQDAACTNQVDAVSMGKTSVNQGQHEQVPISTGKLYLKSSLNIVASCIAGVTCLFVPVGYYD